jgi:hypothetical protein
MTRLSGSRSNYEMIRNLSGVQDESHVRHGDHNLSGVQDGSPVRHSHHKYSRHWDWKKFHWYYPAAFQYDWPICPKKADTVPKEDRSFEYTIDPYTREVVQLYVQATTSICGEYNSTWNRTKVRSVAPMVLRIANWPFHIYNKDYRPGQYNVRLYVKTCFSWFLSVTCLISMALLGLIFQLIKVSHHFIRLLKEACKRKSEREREKKEKKGVIYEYS